MSAKAWIIGNLTRDPEMAETASNVPVCRFSVAVNRKDAKGETVADFYNIIVWRKLGESVARYCKKGSKVAICGDLQIRNFEDNKGQKHTYVDVVAQDVEFLPSKSSSETETRDKKSEEKESYIGSGKKGRRNLEELDEDDADDIPF